MDRSTHIHLYNSYICTIWKTYDKDTSVVANASTLTPALKRNAVADAALDTNSSVTK